MNEEDPSIKLRKYAIRAILVLFVLWLVHFVFTHSIVIINKNDSLSGASLFLSKQGGEKTASKTGAGFHILRTGDYVLTANKDISSSKKSFHVGRFQIKRVGLTLNPQKKTFKVATGAERCSFGGIDDMEKGVLLSYESYDCRSLSSVFINTYGKRSEKKELFGGKYSTETRQTYPLKDGLVGLVGINENDSALKDVELVFINKTGVKRVSLRNYLKDRVVENMWVSVDQDKVYLFEDSSAKLLVFDDLSRPPKEIGRGPQIRKNDGDKVVQFKAQNGKIYILAGKTEQNNTEQLLGGTLYIYSVGGKLENSINVDKHINQLLGFSVLGGDRFISAPIGNNGYLFSLSKDQLHLEQTLFGTQQAVASKDSVFTLSSGRIYQYQPDGTESLVFYSPNIQVTSIENVGSELVFNGHQDNGDNPPNLSYLLTEQAVDNNRREENYIPYSQTSLVAWMDYLGNRVTFAPQLFSLSLHGVDNPTYDADEYKEKSSEIIRELKTDGFSSGEYQITPYPY